MRSFLSRIYLALKIIVVYKINRQSSKKIIFGFFFSANSFFLVPVLRKKKTRASGILTELSGIKKHVIISKY